MDPASTNRDNVTSLTHDWVSLDVSHLLSRQLIRTPRSLRPRFSPRRFRLPPIASRRPAPKPTSDRLQLRKIRFRAGSIGLLTITSSPEMLFINFALLVLPSTIAFADRATHERARSRSRSFHGRAAMKHNHDGGTISKRDSYSGRATYYDVGLGACGGYK